MNIQTEILQEVPTRYFFKNCLRNFATFAYKLLFFKIRLEKDKLKDYAQLDTRYEVRNSFDFSKVTVL